MRWRGKVYGESQVQSCAFCASVATQRSDVGVYVCHRHKQQRLEEIKCTCGNWLEQKSGKFGPYFNCFKCGNINFRKGMELKALQESKIRQDSARAVQEVKKQEPLPEEKKSVSSEKREPKEITIDTNDVQYFD